MMIQDTFRKSDLVSEQIRVLMVDDQMLFTDALGHVLGERNISMITVRSLGELLFSLSTAAQDFDLVIVCLSSAPMGHFRQIAERRVSGSS